MNNEFLTVEEAAKLLNVGQSSIRERVRTGAIPKVPGLGRTIRIPRAALEPATAERSEQSVVIQADPVETERMMLRTEIRVLQIRLDALEAA